jgi:hypothetical protein
MRFYIRLRVVATSRFVYSENKSYYFCGELPHTDEYTEK